MIKWCLAASKQNNRYREEPFVTNAIVCWCRLSDRIRHDRWSLKPLWCAGRAFVSTSHWSQPTWLYEEVCSPFQWDQVLKQNLQITCKRALKMMKNEHMDLFIITSNSPVESSNQGYILSDCAGDVCSTIIVSNIISEWFFSFFFLRQKIQTKLKYFKHLLIITRPCIRNFTFWGLQ